MAAGRLQQRQLILARPREAVTAVELGDREPRVVAARAGPVDALVEELAA